MSERLPRYFVDHETIHDRITGKHVALHEASDLLSVEPEAVRRVAWGAVIDLGVRLKNMEHERDEARRLGEDMVVDYGQLQIRLDEAERERDDALSRLSDQRGRVGMTEAPDVEVRRFHAYPVDTQRTRS